VDPGIDSLPKRLPTRWLVRTAIGQILVRLRLPLLVHGLGCRRIRSGICWGWCRRCALWFRRGRFSTRGFANGRFSSGRSDDSTRDRRSWGMVVRSAMVSRSFGGIVFMENSTVGNVGRTGAQVSFARALHCKNGGFRPLRFSAHYRSIAGGV
jgi:hypothetical protein